MGYQSLEECINDLEKTGQLIRIKEEVDPNLEMATIHLKVFEAGGKAILFENVKGSKYRAVSNVFGTLDRSKFLFRDTYEKVQDLVQLRNNPEKLFKKPWRFIRQGLHGLKAIPKKGNFNSAGFEEISISDLPQIKHWPMDGGAFITLPQVYSEDIDNPGIMHSNLGMYRIQLSGNDYKLNDEIGLHYQLHRGIGVHQYKSNKKGKPLKVSIFVGGPPSHTLAAVMPLPEGMSELAFAGVLGDRKFKYDYKDGFCISLDADFVITGEVFPNDNKPEGPFGDHLGYYSLKHDFPVMKVHKVYAKKNGIWPFTVVGRPPQEDTAFGALIHDISGNAIPKEIPGVKEIHAVDEAGVHPLLLAVGSERYTPYAETNRPSELLTQASKILGTGQLSLAKYLFITGDNKKEINCHDIPAFLQYLFERIDFRRDLHFHTKTSIDTLDYSGEGLNEGSKVVFVAYGEKKRELTSDLSSFEKIGEAKLVFPGVVMLPFSSYTNSENAIKEIDKLISDLKSLNSISGFAQIVLCDNIEFGKDILKDYLWITYTRSNPAIDIYGVNSFISNKHWGCEGPVIIDARKKPHHAPELILDKKVEEEADRILKLTN
ncbi:MAG: UbiD family decarboxylase [Bacteroidia bacterium]